MQVLPSALVVLPLLHLNNKFKINNSCWVIITTKKQRSWITSWILSLLCNSLEVLYFKFKNKKTVNWRCNSFVWQVHVLVRHELVYWIWISLKLQFARLFQIINYLGFKTFLLKYSWFTMLGWFLVYSKVIHFYIYIYILFHILFHYRLLQDIEYSSLRYIQ